MRWRLRAIRDLYRRMRRDRFDRRTSLFVAYYGAKAIALHQAEPPEYVTIVQERDGGWSIVVGVKDGELPPLPTIDPCAVPPGVQYERVGRRGEGVA